MEYKYLLDIGLIILVVKIFTILTQKIKMPKVLGGLIAGIVLGPAMLNIVQNIKDELRASIFKNMLLNLIDE